MDQSLDVLIVNIEEYNWVLSAQLQDDTCKHVMDVWSRNPKDNDERQIHKDYCLKDQRLYRKTDKGKKWVIPKTARRRILMYYHDDAGHFDIGFRRCENMLKIILSHVWAVFIIKLLLARYLVV